MTQAGLGLFQRLRAGLAVAMVVAMAAMAPMAEAQTTGTGLPAVDPTGAMIPNSATRASPLTPFGPGIFRPDTLGSGTNNLDYDAWSDMAARAERSLGDSRYTASDLDLLRSQLVDWREALLGAQSANSTRIANIRSQIAALGPAPAEGTTEVEEIAGRRQELTDQLVRLQAPGIKADEAYQRANGLIGEIDRQRRDRQAEAMLRLWPSPLNPANWPGALADISAVMVNLISETATLVQDPAARAVFVNNLPLALLLLAFAIAILGRGRLWVERAEAALRGRAQLRGARLWAFLASLANVAAPTIGCLALSAAMERTGLLGPMGQALNGLLGISGFIFFSARWLGAQVFPAVVNAEGAPAQMAANLSPERRAEGRFLSVAFGLLFIAARVRSTVTNHSTFDDATTAILIFPLLVIGGLLLIRMGRVLGEMARTPFEEEDDSANTRRIFRLLSKAAQVIGGVAPVLAAVGYITAAASMLQPAAMSLALIGLLTVIQRVLHEGWTLIMRSREGRSAALVPVLMGFVLGLGSLPLFALIWGAEPADLTELWARFQSGFTMGETRISPTDFLIFVAILVAGISVTRLFQGVLKSSILPRTGMDQGGRNAITVGVGYAGIFLSGLAAINATGIDLSGLAIVAGALSVGIGFGLQAIVSNFVSGIILLIERPVSEGDWIEVGSVQGIVKAISVRSTRIQTFDRSDVIVPNQDLITQRVTNWTRFNQTGRLIVTISAPLTADGARVSVILGEVAAAHPAVLKSPVPQALLMAIAGEVQTHELRVFLRDVYQIAAVRSDLNQAVLKRFQDEGLAFSNLHRDFLQKKADDLAAEAELALAETELAGWIAATPARAAGLEAPADPDMADPVHFGSGAAAVPANPPPAAGAKTRKRRKPEPETGP